VHGVRRVLRWDLAQPVVGEGAFGVGGELLSELRVREKPEDEIEQSGDADHADGSF
jgi:hypothetical protein